MVPKTKQELAGLIDHTLLDSVVVREDIVRHCEEAKEHGFYSVCVPERWISAASDLLYGSGVKIDGVVGFPYGTELAKEKARQAEELIFAGADEIDIVADISALLEGDNGHFENELEAVLKVCRSMRPAVVLKVIIESAALNEEQKRCACAVTQKVGVDFVKTSTGLHPAGGATVEDVRFLAECAPGCKIKAAGGIKTAEDALAMLEAGASRIGASRSVDIIQGFDEGEITG